MQKELVAVLASIIISHYILTQKKDRRRTLKPHNESVVIIGSSSGIGRECALQYASRGAKLILFARRQELLAAVQRECQDAGSPQVHVVAGDVTLEADLKRLADYTRETLGTVDTVIYCAGAISVRPFLESCGLEVEKTASNQFTVVEKTPQDISSAIDRITTINYTAAIWSARLFVPLLINSQVPNFLVVSSMAGKAGAPTRALYAGSKHALHGFFDSLRVEWKPYNIHIGLVCPGTVDTELRQSAVDLSLGKGQVAGSKKNKLSAATVATCIIDTSDFRKREVYIPAWFGYAAVWAKVIASPLVDWFAARKYKQ
jgi:short-subunit dehydrogenase